MSFSLNDLQRVYLAYRHMFSGEFAMIRKQASVEKQLKRRYGTKTIACVDARLSRETVILILQDLLKHGIFQLDEANAKLALPCLYKQATRSEMHTQVNSAPQIPQQGRIPPWERTISTYSEPEEPKKLRTQEDAGLPPLNSINIPFHARYTILLSIQHLLEESCFYFTRTHLPSLLEARGWVCAEACELNLWIQELSDHKAELSHAFTAELETTLEVLFAAVSRIRHVTVHREQHDTDQLFQMIQTSINFLAVLGDIHRKAKVEDLLAHFMTKTRELRVEKDLRDTDLEYKRQRIAHLREKLNHREQEANAAAKAAEAVCEELAGSSLKEFTIQGFSLAINHLNNTAAKTVKEQHEHSNQELGQESQHS
jgi:hypothetical protein